MAQILKWRGAEIKERSMQMSESISGVSFLSSWHPGRLIAILALVCFMASCDSGITAEQHLKTAHGYLAENKLNAAIIEIKNALQKEPELPEGRWLLGNAYLQYGQGAAAEREYIIAGDLGYSENKLVPAILRAYLLQHKYQEVIDQTSTSAEGREPSADILTLRGEAFEGLSQTGQAETSFNQALAMDSDSINARLGLTRIALDRHKHEKARALIEEAENIAPNDINVLILKGELALKVNKPEEAEKSYASAAAIADNNITAQFGLIRALLAQEEYDAVLEPLKRVNTLAPDHPMGSYFQAIIALRNADLETARTNLQRVLQVLPNHAESQLLMAQLFYNEGQLEQSQDFLKAFLDQHSDYLQARKLLAAVQIRLKETDAAIDTIRSIITAEGENPQLLSMLATANIESGKVKTGVELLERALEMAPDNTQLRAMLLSAYLKRGATDQSDIILEFAVNEAPELLQSRVSLVATHIKNGAHQAAVTTAEELTNIQSDSAMAHNLLGIAYNEGGDTGQAQERFEHALTLNQEFIPALYNLARLEKAQGNVEAAEKHYQDIIKVDSGHLQTLLQLARLEAGRDEIDKSIELLERARAGNPAAVRPRIILSRYYMATGSRQTLLEVAVETAELAPADDEVQMLLGQAQYLNGRTNEALQTLTALQRKLPDSADILYELARIQLQLGHRDASRNNLDKVLNLTPEHIGALRARIELAIRDNDLMMADSYAQKLQELQPDSSATATLRGDMHLSENRFDKAIAAYKEAYEVDQSFTLASKLTRAYEESGDIKKAMSVFEQWLARHPEAAIKHYESALDKDPNDTVALNNLAWLHIDKDISHAHELAAKAHELAPENSGVIDTLGWILVMQGKHEQGIDLLRKALEQNPDSPDIRYHLAYALAAAGDEERARSELDLILADNSVFLERDKAEELYITLK